MISFSNPFTLQGISQLLQRLSARNFKIYLALAALVTLAGYAALVLFPLLFLVALLKVTFGVGTAASIGDWLALFVWILLGSAGAVVTYSQLRVKTQMPSGLGLKSDKAPRLYELLDELSSHYKVPPIDRIIVHDHFALDIIPVPRFGLPVLKVYVLYIGLPVLQCLAPNHFRGSLARRLGQYAAVENKLTHWIYRFRQYCQQYQRFYARQKGPVYLPMRMFFKFFTPLLNALTVEAARRDELEADVSALSLMNDKELADMIIRSEISNHFLKHKFWPKLHALLRKNPGNPEHTPHVSMAKVVRHSLSENESAQTLKELINSESLWHEVMPDLHTRLANIGQTKLDMPPPVMETAAQRYLGNALGAVLKLLDKQWLAKYGHTNQKQRRAVKKTEHDPDTQQNPFAEDSDTGYAETERQRLDELREMTRQGNLSAQQAVEMAHLTEKVEGTSAAIALYQRILQQDPDNAGTLFDVGRILLSQKDKSGIRFLERAMKLDKNCIAQGCWMLAKYFKLAGDEERSKHYLERAASVTAAA